MHLPMPPLKYVPIPEVIDGYSKSGIRALELGASRNVSNKLREAGEAAQMQMGKAPWQFLYAALRRPRRFQRGDSFLTVSGVLSFELQASPLPPRRQWSKCLRLQRLRRV